MHVITLKKQFLKVDILIFFSFPDLPSLTTIELKEGALQGNGNTDRVASEEEPYYYKNTLIMRSIICDCKILMLNSYFSLIYNSLLQL